MLSRLQRAAVKKAASQLRTAQRASCPVRPISTLSRCTLPTASRFSSIPPLRSSRLFRRCFATETAKVPSLGDSITEGTIVKWSKNVGDTVEQDEVIVIIETDKVSVDIRAPAAGKITSQLAKEGDTIKVGDSLAEIDTSAAGGGGGGAAAEKSAEKPAQSAEKTPEKSAQPAAESKPATPSSSAQPHVHNTQPQQKPVQQGEDEPSASPVAQSGAQHQGKSTSQPGSKQVEQPAPSPPKSQPSATASAPSKPSAPTPSVPAPAGGGRGVRRVPMTRMRQTIAKRLKDAQNTAAMLTTFNEIDMSVLMDVRNKYKDDFFERTGVKLGFMSAFVRASTAALQKFPDVNAYIEGNELVYHEYVDISVAVSTPTGLVVPVLRNTEVMSFAQIEAAIAALGAKARKGQISLEDMTGGTFTISNGGVYGSLFGTPILNPPQSGILGMHGIFKRPVCVNDKVEIRPMMYVALTYDHRVVDGSTAVQFLKEIKNNIEDPVRLLLN